MTKSFVVGCNVAESFEDAVIRFRKFLRGADYPENVEWVEPKDILLTGKRLIYVRVPVPTANEQNVRQLFESSLNRKIGILFETICATKSTTYAFAWSPKNTNEAKHRLMGDGLKLSAKTGLAIIPSRDVTSRLWWGCLEWALRQKQQNKHELFC